MDMTNKFIEQALAGEFGPNQKRIAEVGQSWIELLIRKNTDYKSTIWESPILTPNLNPGITILVRMSDKISRLESLLSKSTEPLINETIEDTITDLGAYCLLYLARNKHNEH